MAARATLHIDPQPHRILVVVDQNLANLLHETARCPFVPQLLATAAVVHRFTQLDCFGKRFGVHVRHHQHFTRVVIGSHHGDEPVVVELRREHSPFFDLLDARSRGIPTVGGARHLVKATSQSPLGGTNSAEFHPPTDETAHEPAVNLHVGGVQPLQHGVRNKEHHSRDVIHRGVTTGFAGDEIQHRAD